MAKCGNCGKPDATVAEIRECYQVSAGTAMMAAQGEAAREIVAQAAPKPEITEGMWRLPGGTIYKVQRAVNGSGRLYGKRLFVSTSGDPGDPDVSVGFAYEPNVVRTLHEGRASKLTLEQAKEFGALYGTCCVCGRTLTNEVSIEAGIGPICGGRLDP